MKAMKYITTETEEGKREIFTFPDTIDHDAMAEAIDRCRNKTSGDWKRITRKPVSAGFVTLEGECYGQSETLGLSCMAGDDDLLDY